MTHIEAIQERIIGEVKSITDMEYLEALLKLVGSSTVRKEKIKLTAEQRSMIEEGLEDFRNGRFFTQEEVEKMDEEWLNDK